MSTTTVDTIPFGVPWPTEEEMAVFDAAEGPIIATESGRTVIPHLHRTRMWGAPGRGQTWIAAQAAIQAVLSGGEVVFVDHVYGNKRGTAILQRCLAALEPNAEIWRDAIDVVETQQWTPNDLKQIRDITVAKLNAAEDPHHSLLVILCASRDNDFFEWNREHVWPWEIAKPDPNNSRTWEPRKGGTLVVVDKSDTRDPLDASSCSYELELRVHCLVGQTPWTDTEAGEVTVTVLKDRHCDTGLRNGDSLAVIKGTPLEDGRMDLTIRDFRSGLPCPL